MTPGLPRLTGPAPGSTAAPRWPYAGPAQRTLVVGALLIVVGSFLPWVSTPLGNLSGMAGPGLWTFSFGVIGVGGAFLRRRRLAVGHGLAAGGCAVALTAWQLARLVQVSVTTAAWGVAVPSTGLLMVLGGGVVALRATWRLHTER